MVSAWIALVAILAITGTASAASWTGEITGGASLPSGNFGSTDKGDASAGWSIGGAADYHWRSDVAFGLDGSYGQNKNGAQGTVFDLGGGDTQTIDKASYTTWSAGGHAKYFFPIASTMPVKWYGLVGAGAYGFNPDVETTTVVGGVSSTSSYKPTDKRGGMRLGLGGEWWSNPKVGITGGVDYNIAFLSKSQSPYSSLSYLGGHVGVTFQIPSASEHP
jgi:hypothetical protein